MNTAQLSSSLFIFLEKQEQKKTPYITTIGISLLMKKYVLLWTRILDFISGSLPCPPPLLLIEKHLNLLQQPAAASCCYFPPNLEFQIPITLYLSISAVCCCLGFTSTVYWLLTAEWLRSIWYTIYLYWSLSSYVCRDMIWRRWQRRQSMHAHGVRRG